MDEHDVPRIPPRQVRAVYTDSTLTVYQAYNPRLGEYAARHGRFPDSYDRGRMTWIKPSFLWMMYRSGWASKAEQERVLAVEITRNGMDWALSHAALSHYDRAVHADRDEWRWSLQRPVRVQWDPERSLTMRPLPYRSLQVGLSGAAVHRYVDDWIVSIRDVTGLAHRIRELVRAGDPESRAAARAALPRERPYPLLPAIGAGLGASVPQTVTGGETSITSSAAVGPPAVIRSDNGGIDQPEG